MTAVAIDHCTIRYRLPGRASGQRRRLEAIVRAALDGVLADAVDRTRIPPHGELCIRSVEAVAALPLREPDSALASRFAGAIADAIEAALRGRSADHVFYASRVHALVDFVGSMLRGDTSRAWAWSQLGICARWSLPRGGDTAALVMRTLAREGPHAVAVLAYVAREEPAFVAMLDGSTAGDWIPLARAALRAAESDADPWREPPERADADAERVAARVVVRSALARAAGRADVAALPPATCRALAALVLLEREPALLRAGGRVAHAALAAVARHLAAPAASPAARDDEGDPAPDDGAIRDAGKARRGPVDPAAAAAPSRATASGVPDVRARAWTAAGGLLYLLNLADRIGLANVLVADPRLRERDLRWTLHALALAVTGIEPTDAAALAFAGLRPGDAAPSREQEPPTDVERAALEEHRSLIVASLRTLLGRLEDTDAAILAFVCGRRAEIAADPGWIEVLLSLDDVSTEIRRVGLDLDPGWVPWLGVVVRFVYA